MLSAEFEDEFTRIIILDRRLLQEFRRHPRVRTEVILEVAVAEYEIFTNPDLLHVPSGQAWNHCAELDAQVRILCIRVEGLPIEYYRCGMFVTVSQRPTLIMVFPKATTSPGCSSATMQMQLGLYKDLNSDLAFRWKPLT